MADRWQTLQHLILLFSLSSTLKFDFYGFFFMRWLKYSLCVQREEMENFPTLLDLSHLSFFSAVRRNFLAGNLKVKQKRRRRTNSSINYVSVNAPEASLFIHEKSFPSKRISNNIFLVLLRWIPFCWKTPDLTFIVVVSLHESALETVESCCRREKVFSM